MIKANPSPNGNGFAFNLFGDPYGIRTHDTAVKGRCLNRLTKGPYSFVILRRCDRFNGSGGRIRTNDLPGMNRPL